LPSPNSDPAQSVERDDAGADEHERLTAALAKLDERSRLILSRRWLAENKATLHELAAEFGVSAERIRQIEANAIGKLKKQLAAA
jgi:RNA polymerase sigma-32 factor